MTNRKSRAKPAHLRKRNLTIRRPWTEEEERLLREQAQTKTKYEWAEELNRTPGSVAQRACLLGTHVKHEVKIKGKTYVAHRWTKADVNHLLVMAGRVSIRDAASRLGLREAQVRNKIDDMGIEWNRGISRSRFAEILGVSRWSVSKYSRKMNTARKIQKVPLGYPLNFDEACSIAQEMIDRGAALEIPMSRLKAIAEGNLLDYLGKNEL